MNTCDQCRESILDHLYGLLEAEATADLSRHLASCPACQAELSRAEKQKKLLALAARTGEARYEEFFTWLQQRFPARVVFHQGHNNELAHLIEAGADMLLMPSRYEPCGLNQMFSLRYGTIPIVRRTGGLADTVRPYDPDSGEGTGFVFENFTPDGLRWALKQALRTYSDRPAWKQLMANAMAENFSWETQAKRYVEAYSWLVRP